MTCYFHGKSPFLSTNGGRKQTSDNYFFHNLRMSVCSEMLGALALQQYGSEKKCGYNIGYYWHLGSKLFFSSQPFQRLSELCGFFNGKEVSGKQLLI